MFSSDEAEDAGGLSPTKDDNKVWRKQAQRIIKVLGLTDYSALWPPTWLFRSRAVAPSLKFMPLRIAFFP